MIPEATPPVLAPESLAASRILSNLPPAALYEEAIRRGEGQLAAGGPLVCLTTPHTGRSPKDKFIVKDAATEAEVAWGAVNRPLAPAHFAALRADMMAALRGTELFVQDCAGGADPRYRMPVRVITERAWHSLFAQNLLLNRAGGDVNRPGLTIIDIPSFKADPARHGTRSEVVIAVNFVERLVLIGGTGYAGEIKKSVFSVLNYLLPFDGVLPMHCSANIGRAGDTALFFGLSGTGKTTLSSDPGRRLIGDDEHGWSDTGVFNFEGGCYAKTIRLSPQAEPQIYATTQRFGTVIENVPLDEQTRQLLLDDDRHTENTRAAYPIEFIDNIEPSGCGGHPRHIVMLTADAFGVLPPIARLTPEGAMYHFLSGYTAKVAGTERGVTEPSATFSTGFGAPFLPLAPSRYARMLGERIARHDVRVWLVNTGWTGGAYGKGTRMKLAHTRTMIAAAIEGRLDGTEFDRDPIFNVDIPRACPDVPAEILQPRRTWPGEADYLAQANRVAGMFLENFEAFAKEAGPDIVAAGPRPPVS
ncbi:MAG: phosphoenolpyruvate carboxykinase (ATP) [Vicinamibacterales bacterium]